MKDRVMPHSLDAERSILGAVLADNEALVVAAAIIRPEMFYRPANAILWRHMLKLADAKEPIDSTTVAESMTRAGDFADFGGPMYLSDILDKNWLRSTNVDAYARTVRDDFTRRQCILGAMKVIDTAYDRGNDIDDVIEHAERYVMHLARATAPGGFMLAEDWARELSGQIEYAYAHKRAVTGIPTGFPTLDKKTRGLQPAELVFIAARPSVGKTCLMMQLAEHAADHTMTGVVSLEMTRKDVGFRLVSQLEKVNQQQLQTGELPEEEYKRVGLALTRIGNKRMAIYDGGGLSDTQLCAAVRRLHAQYGLGVLFVDYLGLLMTDGRSENRNIEVSKMSRGLKVLAKDLHITVVLVSQLNRDSAKTNRRPQLSDLRDSGSLEQDADVVLLLHRPDEHKDGQAYKDGEKVELLIEKQRNGSKGKIDLMWVGKEVRFGEATTRSDQ